MEPEGAVFCRTFVLLNFRSKILATPLRIILKGMTTQKIESFMMFI